MALPVALGLRCLGSWPCQCLPPLRVLGAMCYPVLSLRLGMPVASVPQCSPLCRLFLRVPTLRLSEGALGRSGSTGALVVVVCRWRGSVLLKDALSR